VELRDEKPFYIEVRRDYSLQLCKPIDLPNLYFATNILINYVLMLLDSQSQKKEFSKSKEYSIKYKK